MSSVPYSGSIAYNLSTSLLLGTCSALSAMAWWDRQPAEGQEPNLIQRAFTVSDNAPGAVGLGSVVCGALAADIFARGVAAPLYEKGKAAALRAVQWVKNYRCRADGAAALAMSAAGATTCLTSYATGSTVGMAVGLLPLLAGPAYLNSQYGQGAITPPSAPVLPSAFLSPISPAKTVEITPQHPLHVDAPYRMKYSGGDTIRFSSVGAAFVARMCKPEYVTENADAFIGEQGEKLRDALNALGQNELLKDFVPGNPKLAENYVKLMTDTLDVKFGIGKSKNSLTDQQKKFRDELKKTCGNLKHCEIKAGNRVLITEKRMTEIFKDLYEVVVEEDRKGEASQAYRPVSSSSYGGVSSSSRGASNLWGPGRHSSDADGF